MNTSRDHNDDDDDIIIQIEEEQQQQQDMKEKDTPASDDVISQAVLDRLEASPISPTAPSLTSSSSVNNNNNNKKKKHTNFQPLMFTEAARELFSRPVTKSSTSNNNNNNAPWVGTRNPIGYDWRRTTNPLAKQVFFFSSLRHVQVYFFKI